MPRDLAIALIILCGAGVSVLWLLWLRPRPACWYCRGRRVRCAHLNCPQRRRANLGDLS